MSESQARRRGVTVATLSVVIAGAVVLAAGMLVHAVCDRSQEDTRQRASRAEIAASLAQGVAWVWPDSNGPQGARGAGAPYREAAVLVESLVLRAGGVEHGGRTQTLALPAG